ncbi:hypothetical protein NDU88_000695 [Pleurodeles waltl]|uniref:Uncharacterized protein n=1 Tax=Pleurodeles waltl TaxID=8319 RepID=A0AAV7M369_PLEWA|nr:hypothetical protein NDU88_000695 [Pleurodeles waltl]
MTAAPSLPPRPAALGFITPTASISTKDGAPFLTPPAGAVLPVLHEPRHLLLASQRFHYPDVTLQPKH